MCLLTESLEMFIKLMTWKYMGLVYVKNQDLERLEAVVVAVFV